MGFDLPDSMVAELAFIKINVDKAEGAGHDPTQKLFAGAFQIDLKSTAGEAGCFLGTESACTETDAKITFADLGGTTIDDLFGVSLAGRSIWTGSSRPRWTRRSPACGQTSSCCGPSTTRPRCCATTHHRVQGHRNQRGQFLQGLLGDVVREIKRVTGPVQPVIDTLYAPIPVLSDLSRLAGGDDVTLVTLAKSFSTLAGGPKFVDFVDTIKAVIEFINRLPSCTPDAANDCFVPIGGFEVDGDKALTTSNSPTTADKMFKSSAPIDGTTVKNALNDKNDNPAAAGKPIFGSSPATKGDVEKSGFTFPILDNPASAFNLLMGGDITLVEFDSGPLTLGSELAAIVRPGLRPTAVFVTLAGSASVPPTYPGRPGHLRHPQGRRGLSSRPGRRRPRRVGRPVLQNGRRERCTGARGPTGRRNRRGCAVSALIITVGIEGRPSPENRVFWNDPNDDGKFRVEPVPPRSGDEPAVPVPHERPVIAVPPGLHHDRHRTVLGVLQLHPRRRDPARLLGRTRLHTTAAQARRNGRRHTRGVRGVGRQLYRGAPWGNTAATIEQDVVKVIALHYDNPADQSGEDPAFDGFAVEMLGERREFLDPNLNGSWSMAPTTPTR